MACGQQQDWSGIGRGSRQQLQCTGMTILTNLRDTERKLPAALTLLEAMASGTASDVRTALAACIQLQVSVRDKVQEVLWCKTVSESLNAKQWEAWAASLVLPGDGKEKPQELQEGEEQQRPPAAHSFITEEAQEMCIIRAVVDTMRSPSVDIEELLAMTSALTRHAASETSRSKVRHDVKALHILLQAAVSGVVDEDGATATQEAMEQVSSRKVTNCVLCPPLPAVSWVLRQVSMTTKKNVFAKPLALFTGGQQVMSRVSEAVSAFAEQKLFQVDLQAAEEMVQKLETHGSSVDSGVLVVADSSLRAALHAKLIHITSNAPPTFLQKQQERLAKCVAARDGTAEQLRKALAAHLRQAMRSPMECLCDILSGGWPETSSQAAVKALDQLPGSAATQLLTQLDSTCSLTAAVGVRS